jgi:2-polyprenyl-3-methyl-5-hydroxy-6-metoxy-1,4-benzoquinol methylase
MWYGLNRLEGVVFFLPFLIYASIKHIPYSTRCSRCGKRTFNYENCRDRLCETCLKKAALNSPAELHEGRRSRALNTRANPGETHIYRRVAGRIGQGKILDVGCGVGSLLAGLETSRRDLYGVDIITPQAGGKTSHIKFITAPATHLPFEAGIFDYVTCTEVLEHIESDDAIKECFRVLKPGGTALITVPNGSGPFGRIAEHIRYFSFQTMSELLKNAGFTIVGSAKFGLYLPILTRSMMILSLVAGKDMPLSYPLNLDVPESIATSFFFECRKPSSPVFAHTKPAGGF